MYAIVQSGGKQYKAAEGKIISVDKLAAQKGDKIHLEVLMTSEDGKITVGTPVIKNAVVEAEVMDHYKDKKIIVYKYKSKKNERKKQGHRQPYTALKILSIKL